MYSGKALLDALDQSGAPGLLQRNGQSDTDFYWYLWVGARSPLFGKEKVTTFERYFTEEPELRNEPKNAYYTLIEEQATAERILKEFGLDPDDRPHHQWPYARQGGGKPHQGRGPRLRHRRRHRQVLPPHHRHRGLYPHL